MTTTKPHTTFPTIMLPGPCIAAHTVTISGETTHPNGIDEIKLRAEIQGNGDPNQVIKFITDNRESGWGWLVGCDIAVDYGKRPIHYTLNEYFGELSLEKDAPK